VLPSACSDFTTFYATMICITVCRRPRHSRLSRATKILFYLVLFSYTSLTLTFGNTTFWEQLCYTFWRHAVLYILMIRCSLHSDYSCILHSDETLYSTFWRQLYSTFWWDAVFYILRTAVLYILIIRWILHSEDSCIVHSDGMLQFTFWRQLYCTFWLYAVFYF
jgi:hypothetical protein